MKKSKAISRAFERLDTPSLSYDFNARLMARVRERAREQRRTDIIVGIFASATIIAMVAYGVSTMIAIKFFKQNRIKPITETCFSWLDFFTNLGYRL